MTGPLTAFGRPLPLPADDRLREWPILAVAAACWDEERTQAFRIVYAAMRRADDLVDERRKQSSPISAAERAEIQRAFEPREEARRPLQDVRDSFAIPDWVWRRWSAAMSYDLTHDGFQTWRDFVRYSLGAAVAPGAIFLHLAAAPRDRSIPGRFLPPAFDVERTARPLALFAYVVHILRDFQQDQRDGLNSFPCAVLKAHGLERSNLRHIAMGATPAPEAFRRLLETYCDLARRYRVRARREIERIGPLLTPRARLSVEIVLDLYTQLLERAQMTPASMAPSMSVPPDELRDRLARLLARHGGGMQPPA